MNNRTPLLLGAMALIVGIWVADQFKVFSFIDNFGKGHQAQLDKLTNDTKKLEDLILKGSDAADKLDIYQQRALPYDLDGARSKYQLWLSRLVKTNEMSRGSSVEVGMPASITIEDGGKKKEAYRRYSFTMNCGGTLQQVTQLLFDFYQTGHLHKINTLSLVRSGGGRFNLSIGGEALGLATGDRKAELSQVAGNRLAKASVVDYSTIVRRNIFSREVGATLKLISLSSVTFDRTGIPEAWFKVGAPQQTKKLQRGGKFTVAVHEIEVIDIQPRSVLVAVDGSVFDLAVGESLFDAMTAMEVAAK